MSRTESDHAFRVRRGKMGKRDLTPRILALVLAGALGACASKNPETQAQVQPLVGGLAEQVADDPAIPHNSGVAHLRAGRLGLALRSFRLAMRREPDSIETLNAIGVTYDQMGRFDLSRRYFERALMIEPNSVQTLNNLGHSNLRQGRIDVAWRYLQRAEELAENNPIVKTNVQLATAQTQTSKQRHFSASDANAKAPKRTPLTWIERNTLKTQTLITEPAAGGIASASGPAIAAQLVSVRGRLDDTALPPSTHAAVSSSIRRHKPASPAANRPKAVIEISNGAGRRRMAGRIGQYLAGRGLQVQRVTNADSFSYRRTVIFYRPEFRSEAERLAEMLPVDVTLTPHSLPSSDVRAILGGDLLDFDRTSLYSRQQEV